MAYSLFSGKLHFFRWQMIAINARKISFFDKSSFNYVETHWATNHPHLQQNFQRVQGSFLAFFMHFPTLAQSTLRANASMYSLFAEFATSTDLFSEKHHYFNAHYTERDKYSSFHLRRLWAMFLSENFREVCRFQGFLRRSNVKIGNSSH